jgi:lipid II:glycine glycyltransferase (peptidoglycan interpeptide bridge formation enzyme)
VAGAYITFAGNRALYKDGGSRRDTGNLQAPYLLQWEIIRWLKSNGIKEYDLHGVPPFGEPNSDSSLDSLVQFKTGFNPDATQYIGTYDLPIKLSAYDRWLKFGERWAERYERRVKRRLFY